MDEVPHFSTGLDNDAHKRGFGTLSLRSWSGWDECGQLVPAHGAATPAAWKERLELGFKQIRAWFTPSTDAEHQHLGSALNVLIWKQGWESWAEALNEAGKVFHNFRRAENNHKPELLAAFGLPIRFRNHPARFADLDGFNRAPSRLQFRVAVIDGKYHPVVWCADGPLAPKEPRLRYKGSYGVHQPNDRLLSDFFEHIRPRCV
jgi:hypothetical protein